MRRKWRGTLAEDHRERLRAQNRSLFGFAFLSFCSLVPLVYIYMYGTRETSRLTDGTHFLCHSQWHCVLTSSGFPAMERDQFYSQLDFQPPVKSFQSHQSCNMSRITKAALQKCPVCPVCPGCTVCPACLSSMLR